MSLYRITFCLIATLTSTVSFTSAQEKRIKDFPTRTYEYESKPEGDEFAVFNPAKAPQTSGSILKKGDRLAIIGGCPD